MTASRDNGPDRNLRLSEDKAVVAMSGGVDSSVAAYLARESGLDVIGITMQVWPTVDEGPSLPRRCCSLEAVGDARRAAWQLGIPHYVLNFRKSFEEMVVDPFVKGYMMGRTPNPCVACNKYIKFDLLLTRTAELGAKWLVTGHYARVLCSPTSRTHLLLKAADPSKDQSYVLYMLSQENLCRILLPLGGLRKSDVRAMARRLGLAVASKAESQDICFIPDGDYRRYITERAPANVSKGPVLDTQGRVLGEHSGLHNFTIGQRRGLGIASGRPLYVVAIDNARNAVIVGDKEDLAVKEFITIDNNFIAADDLAAPLEVQVKVRYRSPLVEAIISPLSKREVLVRLRGTQMGVAPGQAAVFYAGDVVVGGGTIDRVLTRKW